MPRQARDRGHIRRLFIQYGEIPRHSPEANLQVGRVRRKITYLSILRRRGEEGVVERIKIGIKDRCRMAFEERDEVGELAPFFKGDHSKGPSSCTASTSRTAWRGVVTCSIPIEREIEWIDFDQVAVPG